MSRTYSVTALHVAQAWARGELAVNYDIECEQATYWYGNSEVDDIILNGDGTVDILLADRTAIRDQSKFLPIFVIVVSTANAPEDYAQ